MMLGRFSFWIADMSNHVRIVMTGHGQGEVFMNGEKVEGVTGFEVIAGVEVNTTVLLEILAPSVEIEAGEADVATRIAGTPLEADGVKRFAAVADGRGYVNNQPGRFDNDAMDNQES